MRPDNITAFCSSTDPDILKESYIGVLLKDKRYLQIYDTTSNELGHGGPPFLGQIGSNIYNTGNITINAYLGFGEGPALLGDLAVQIRGEKKFITTTDESISVNLSAIAIPGNDPRLIEYLKPYSKEDGFDKPVIDSENLNIDALINNYFKPSATINTPEFFALEKMKKELNAITAQ